MELHDVVRWLLEATCAGSAAIVFVLSLRKSLRRRFGSRVTYAAWWLVPAAMAAVSLPSRVVELQAREMTLSLAMRVGPITESAAGSLPDLPTVLMLVWLTGALAFAVDAVLLQRRFLRQLGKVVARPDGLLQAESSLGLPAVVGVRARIVLPADFDTRYSERQRELILAHERVHVARGDVFCNAFAVFARCLFWFNPLSWIAGGVFRHDQELACDETVIARHAGARRAYGEAMMKTQLSMYPAPLACHWFAHHPIKERILMLKEPVPSLRRAMAGTAVVVLLACCAGAAAWAAKPPVYVAAGAGLMPHPENNTKIAITADNRPAREVAQQAARLAGVTIDNVDLLSNKAVTLRFTDMAISTIMNIVADESGVAAGWKGNQVRFFPKTEAKAIQASASDAKAIAVPAPAYPATATTANQSGKVVLRLLVATDGSVKDARVVKSTPAGVFDEPSLKAVREWKFDPATKDGKAIESWIQVPITFENDKRDDEAVLHPSQSSIQDASAYDWIRVDPRKQANVQAMNCDALVVDDQTDATRPISWCGNRKGGMASSQ